MNTFISSIKKIDIYGRDYTFYESNSKSFKTFLGFVLTLITYVSTAAFGILFGLEIFQKNNPYIATSYEMLSESIVRLNDFPFIFTFRNPDGTFIKNIDSIFDFSVETYSVDKNGYPSIITSQLVDCNVDDISNKDNYKLISDLITPISNFSTKCFGDIKNLFVKNPYGINNSQFISVDVLKCDKTRRECNPDVDQFTKNIYVSIFFIDSYLDTNNYEFPVKLFVNSNTQGLSYGTRKRTFMRLSNNLIQSDNGWILSNFVDVPFISLKDTKFDIGITNTNQMYHFTIESPFIREFTKRRYMKIQDLFAKVGGFYSAIVILIGILVTDYVRFKFHQNVEKLHMKNIKNFKERDQLNAKSIRLNNFVKTEPINKDNESIKQVFKKGIEINNQNFIKSEDQFEWFFANINYLSFIRERICSCFKCKEEKYDLSEKLFSYSTYISISSRFIQQTQAKIGEDKKVAEKNLVQYQDNIN